MPIISAKAKSLSVSPPNSSSAVTGQQRAEARRQRSRQHLGHRAVDDLRERRARHSRHVLAHTIEHDDRVVERIPEDRQQRRDRRRRHFPAGQRVDARRDQQVVHQRDQHRHRVLPLEAQRDVGGDHQQRGDDRDDRALGDRFPERRPDRGRGEASWLPNFVSSAASTFFTRVGRERLGRDLKAGAADALVGDLLDLGVGEAAPSS